MGNPLFDSLRKQKSKYEGDDDLVFINSREIGDASPGDVMSMTMMVSVESVGGGRAVLKVISTTKEDAKDAPGTPSNPIWVKTQESHG